MTSLRWSKNSDGVSEGPCFIAYKADQFIVLGEVPEDWKKANATLVIKKGKKEYPGNYQPVSLASIPGKVMEHLILEAISTHVEDKKMIQSSHHGFTRGKSCLTNMIAFYDETTAWMDERRAVDIIYLNFSKAFETLTASS
ncbi:hypothetical protein HGM15179_019227 [Zosterops borbonicus]|uniref:Reverse transcriptase domain-containing protein n=1 Tax=Zosterops borbonicus TaxID=364589 RepID=A0A8K1DBJ9_9PASS|nr:hypothetical protein HGM15179_019227 [Zosterops borbonicus]